MISRTFSELRVRIWDGVHAVSFGKRAGVIWFTLLSVHCAERMTAINRSKADLCLRGGTGFG